MNQPDDLRGEFDGVEALLPEKSIIVEGGDVIHRPDPGAKQPACSTSSGAWKYANTADALHLGMVPCRVCWWSAADYLAGEAESPVERRKPLSDAPEGDAADMEELLADGAGTASLRDRKLASRPEEVLVTSGAKRCYHAPTADGSPLCDHNGDYRRVERAVLAGHADPCGECFDLDALDGETPTDSSRREIHFGKPEMPRLVDYPEIVLATNGSAKRYHAPTEEGPACGTDADHRRGKREALEPHYQPCTDCFDVEEIEENRDRVIR